MKIKGKDIVIISLLLLIIAGFITIMYQDYNKANSDGKKFKEEYEKLNGKATGNEEKKYLPVEIDEKNPMMYKDLEEILEILEDKTGVIYFGFPECPWCRNLVPALMDAIKETEYKNVYYCNALKDRDKKHLDEDGKIVIDQEGSNEYYDLVKKLDKHLNSYKDLNDESIKRLYFPTVVFVKDGKIVAFHEDTVASQEDPYKPLDKKQHEELMNILITGIKKVQGILCTDDSKC